MRKQAILLTLTFLACDDADVAGPFVLPDGGLDDAGALDAGVPDAGGLDAALELDAAVDAAPDAAAPQDAALNEDATIDARGLDAGDCRPTVLLAGGSDVAAQGWMIAAQDPHTLMYVDDYVRLATSTASGGRTSGQLLLYYPAAVQVPFKLEVVLQVESVSTHNSLDSAAAILGSFTPSFGSGRDRAQMVYLDSAAVGWADDTQSAASSVVDGLKHTYVLSVDEQNVARLTVDGVAKLTRNDYQTNGTVAVGDQTNDGNVDAALRVFSVKKLCP
ncbi:MAG: hypothetical protein ABW352_00665 [Polyangiales bacterium]